MTRPIITVLLSNSMRSKKHRYAYIKRSLDVLSKVPNMVTIVMGDEIEKDPTILHMANEANAPYLVEGPTKNHFREQKTAALNNIMQTFLGDDYVIYFTVHNHMWAPPLWDELRTVDTIGILPLGNTSQDPGRCERPIYVNGKLYTWLAAYSGRRFPTGTGGYAINRQLLGNEPKNWFDTHKGSDSGFLASFGYTKHTVMPLCDECNRRYAWQSVDLDDPIGKGEFPSFELPRYKLVDKGDWNG